MAMLNRSDWYDIARSTNWTPRYVSEAALFPDTMSDGYGLSPAQWEAYDEPYKTTYREYVSVQRGKDAEAYAVRSALKRTGFIDKLEPGWQSVLKVHYGALAIGEWIAGHSEARMTRFSKAPGMRNMATFGMMDETRHAQLQLLFPHDFVQKDPQFLWAHKAMQRNQWAAVAARHLIDDMFLARDAINIAIMLTFAFETGFTNMQFLGLAADAAREGDITFASLISSIQTDESRHAQIGAPALKVLIENGKADEAQKIVDVAFWRTWKLFSILTGPVIDYYTPLEKREASFKEFMLEWIVGQFERTMLDLGLKLPWYWDTFMHDIEETHHCMHMGVWYWRATLWWNSVAGVTPDERDWLEQKYPGWNDSWGKCWDVMTENVLANRKELTQPETLPVLCNMCNLPIVGRPHDGWNLKIYTHDYQGRRYNFGSEVDRWCFIQDPERYKEHLSVVDRFLAGAIQPPTLEGAIAYMGLNEEEMGKEAHDFAWAGACRPPLAAE